MSKILQVCNTIINKYKKNRGRFIYPIFLNAFPVWKKKVFIESYWGKEFSCNPYALYQYLKREKKYKHLKFVVVQNRKYNKVNGILMKKTKVVNFQSIMYWYHLATSKFLVNNVTFPAYFLKREGQVYLNTWHGTPYKKLGNDIENSGTEIANVIRNFLQADYILSQNKFTTNIILDAYDIRGITDNKIIEEGYPRMDLTLCKSEINEKIALYAPTWRDDLTLENVVEKIKYELDIMQEELDEDWTIVIKGHQFLNNILEEEIESDDRLQLFDNKYNLNEYLKEVDLLVTDYSSIFFDFAILKRPIIHLLVDKERYLENRGLYLEDSELPGIVATSYASFKKALKNPYEYEDKFSTFINKYLKYDDGKVCEKISDILFNVNESKYNVVKHLNNKPNVMFYCGGFLQNGITTSAVHLLNRMDTDKYNVIIVDKSKNLDMERVHQVKNPQVKKIYRTAIFLVTPYGYIKNKIYMYKMKYLGLNDKKPDYNKHTYEREFRRMFGNVQADYFIDFGGYNEYWARLAITSNVKNSIIFQHSNYYLEYFKVSGGRRSHQQALNIIFDIYKDFNKIIAVSKETMELNFKKLSQFYNKEQIDYIENFVDGDEILTKSKEENLTADELKALQTLEEAKKSQEPHISDELADKINVYYRILGRKRTRQKSKIDNIIEESEFLRSKLSPYAIKDFDNVLDELIEQKKNHNKAYTVSMIGRLSSEKNHRLMIDVIKQLNLMGYNVKLFIVGTGRDEEEIREYVVNEQLQEKVYFLGYQSNPFIFMDACDILALPSLQEGQPMVLLESIILNKKIIASDIPANHSVLKGKFGHEVPLSQQEFLTTMVQLLAEENPNYNFDWIGYNDKIFNKWSILFTELKEDEKNAKTNI